MVTPVVAQDNMSMTMDNSTMPMDQMGNMTMSMDNSTGMTGNSTTQ
jgi:ACT domain-containing protein